MQMIWNKEPTRSWLYFQLEKIELKKKRTIYILEHPQNWVVWCLCLYNVDPATTKSLWPDLVVLRHEFSLYNWMKQSDLFHLFRFDYTSTLMCAILLFLSLDLFLKKLLCSFAPKIIKAFATDLLPLVKFKNLVIAKSMLHIRIATKKKGVSMYKISYIYWPNHSFNNSTVYREHEAAKKQRRDSARQNLNHRIWCSSILNHTLFYFSYFFHLCTQNRLWDQTQSRFFIIF